MSAIGVIDSIWRYPVKSMAGEQLEKAYLGFSGVYGDRLFAFKSTGSPEAFPYLTTYSVSRQQKSDTLGV